MLTNELTKDNDFIKETFCQQQRFLLRTAMFLLVLLMLMDSLKFSMGVFFWRLAGFFKGGAEILQATIPSYTKVK